MHSGSDLEVWSLERIAEKNLARSQSQPRAIPQVISPAKRTVAEAEAESDDEVPEQPAPKRKHVEASKKRTRPRVSESAEEASQALSKKRPVSPKKLTTLNRA